MYELLEQTEGENATHGVYNALTRRLISFLHAAEHAQSARKQRSTQLPT